MGYDSANESILPDVKLLATLHQPHTFVTQ